MLLLMGWAGATSAQQAEYTVEIDTNYILIGDQIRLKMQVSLDRAAEVTFPLLRDTLVSGVEIVSGPVRDSLREKGGQHHYWAEYRITSFDTGVYVLPSLPVSIAQDGYDHTMRSDPMHLIVNTYVVDPEKGNYDIVLPIKAPWTFSELWPYLLWGGGIALILALAGWLVYRWRTHRPLFEREEPVVPPYEVAMQALDEIKAEKSWRQGRTKEYYTQLTETLRVYMEGELGIAAMEQTSDEIMADLAQAQEVGGDDRRLMADLLATSDLVKFAKADPGPDENLNHLNVAYDFVSHTHREIQRKELEEKARQEALRARREEQEKDAEANGADEHPSE